MNTLISIEKEEMTARDLIKILEKNPDAVIHVNAGFPTHSTTKLNIVDTGDRISIEEG